MSCAFWECQDKIESWGTMDGLFIESFSLRWEPLWQNLTEGVVRGVKNNVNTGIKRVAREHYTPRVTKAVIRYRFNFMEQLATQRWEC